MVFRDLAGIHSVLHPEPMESRPLSTLTFYLSAEHPCSYLPGHLARTLFVDPEESLNIQLYQKLIDLGFRRSGDMLYKPHCNGCKACIAARIPVGQFHPSRSQRRNWKGLFSEVRVSEQPPLYQQAHFDLFRRYVEARHGDGEMAETSEEGYRQFLLSSWCQSKLLEFHDDTGLLAVAVTDFLADGLSALYTFFDPDRTQSAPGVYSILWQIELAKKTGLPYLYLGYWISDCRKMAYKIKFRPLELLIDNSWQLIP